MYYYKEIQKKYKNKKTKRSNVSYMAHIDEGIIILNKIKSKENTIAAFCLHPLFQDNKSLLQSLHNTDLMDKINKEVIVLLMEYRKTANYFSSRSTEVSKPRLSPIREVNEMLLADKIHNYRDFLLYQKKHLTPDRYNWLNNYFKLWIQDLLDYFSLDISLFKIHFKSIPNFEETFYA